MKLKMTICASYIGNLVPRVQTHHQHWWKYLNCTHFNSTMTEWPLELYHPPSTPHVYSIFQQQCFPSVHFVVRGGCKWVTTALSVTCQFERLWKREIAAELKAPCLGYLLNTRELSRLESKYAVWRLGNTGAYWHLWCRTHFADSIFKYYAI